MEKTFLICSERSGGNFVSRLLNAHSNICSPPPKHLLSPFLKNIYRYEPLLENWEELLIDVNKLMNAEFTFWKSEINLENLKQNVTQGNVFGLIDYIFELEARENNKIHLFIKENKIYEFLPYLLKAYPNAKYVFQVRDPRDMALSWKKNPTHPGGIVKAAKQWKTDQQNSLINSYLLKKNKNLITIKYEELSQSTEDTLKSIMIFLGLSYEKDMLNYHLDEQNKKNAQQQHAWSNISKGVMSDNFNKYKRELTAKEISYIEKICFFEMISLGYEPINSWDNLKKISSKDISNYDSKEMHIHPQELTKGVKENIDAKTTFYQKIFS